MPRNKVNLDEMNALQRAEYEAKKLKRMRAQGRAYGSLTISPTIVKGYESGRYSMDTLLNNIAKYNKVENIYAEDWRLRLSREIERNGIEGLKNLSKFRNFWGEYAPEQSYKGSMNDALAKVDGGVFTEKGNLYKTFGKNLNFMDWDYDQEQKHLYKIVNGTRWEVSFVDGRKTGDYGAPSSVLVVNRVKVA